MNEYVEVILKALWFFLPSMVGGIGATIAGGGIPIDLGKNFVDGKRFLGDGKTYNGLLGGVILAIIVGIFQTLAVHYTPVNETWHFGTGFSAVYTIMVLGFGSIFGDVLGSFIKRRLGVERGEKFPVMDQYDYVLGTLVVLVVLRWSFFYQHYIEGIAWVGLLVLLVQTPIVHRLVNIIGYQIGLKKVPW
ncbi:MAG TPA: CDP-2,3-bis-(O-geranylgeranyl)-sn-glycerol synthase [Euryarchaeota archaeon]|nr:CDP-2,3-bis-(O-geranylgeranyl)-sn-glycerol synthase [Euryarchaeota archaeon]